MRRAKASWPGLGNFGLALAGFTGVWVSMSILDVVATRYMGLDAWPGSFQAVSFWGGEFYQFPFYELVLFPSPFVACAFLIYYADADGYTVIERGIAQLHGVWWRNGLRVLSFIAFCNLLNLTYTGAMGIHAVYADPWPANMPTWLIDEQCGGITGVACRP